jgi:hypothetical protein
VFAELFGSALFTPLACDMQAETKQEYAARQQRDWAAMRNTTEAERAKLLVWWFTRDWPEPGIHWQKVDNKRSRVVIRR